MWEVHHANQMLESCCRSESLIHFCLPRDEHFVISIFKLGASRLRKFKPMQIPFLACVKSGHKMSVYHIRCAQYQLHLLLGDQLAVPDFENGELERKR